MTNFKVALKICNFIYMTAGLSSIGGSTFGAPGGVWAGGHRAGHHGSGQAASCRCEENQNYWWKNEYCLNMAETKAADCGH